jgi:2-oxoglutarate dehydrogenase E2 component (dihydrolipoamide succinyltransferase)
VNPSPKPPWPVVQKTGDAVNADEPLVELETDKVTVEVPAPASGALGEIVVKEGDTVEVGALLGMLAEGAAMAAAAPASTEPQKCRCQVKIRKS